MTLGKSLSLSVSQFPNNSTALPPREAVRVDTVKTVKHPNTTVMKVIKLPYTDRSYRGTYLISGPLLYQTSHALPPSRCSIDTRCETVPALKSSQHKQTHTGAKRGRDLPNVSSRARNRTHSNKLGLLAATPCYPLFLSGYNPGTPYSRGAVLPMPFSTARRPVLSSRPFTFPASMLVSTSTL